MTLEQAYEHLKNTGLLKKSAESRLKVYKTYKRFRTTARSHWEAVCITAVKHSLSEQHVNNIVRDFK